MQKAINTPHDWSEDRLQAELYIWFHNTFPNLRGLLFAVPNGGHRNGLQAKLLKATGVFPGVSDMIFLYAKRAYFLELKRPDGEGVQSDAQKDWEKQVKSQGFIYKLYNDLDELKKFILEIIVASEDKDNYPHKQLNLF